MSRAERCSQQFSEAPLKRYKTRFSNPCGLYDSGTHLNSPGDADTGVGFKNSTQSKLHQLQGWHCFSIDYLCYRLGSLSASKQSSSFQHRPCVYTEHRDIQKRRKGHGLLLRSNTTLLAFFLVDRDRANRHIYADYCWKISVFRNVFSPTKGVTLKLPDKPHVHAYIDT